MMQGIINNSVRQTRTVAIACGLVLLVSCVASTAYRGTVHDEGISVFDRWAKAMLDGRPVFTDKTQELGTKGPARLIYVILIAIAYKFLGVTLLSLHIFPYLLQILNPCLFFWLAAKFYHNPWWALAGALAFIFHPFNLIYLNQQHNHPIFIFFLLLMTIAYQYAKQQPRALGLMGIAAALLFLTRFEDSVIFIGLTYSLYIIEQWKSGIHWKWLVISLMAFCATYIAFALLFNFPILYMFDYIPHLLERQDRATSLTFQELSQRIFRILLYWYFGGKFTAPGLLLLLITGAVTHIRKRILYPIALFLPYFLFITLIFNGREDVGNLEPITFASVGFILLLMSGVQGVTAILPGLLRKFRQPSPQTFTRIAEILILLLIFAAFGRSSYSLARMIEGPHPSTNMWRILTHNPKLPGNPAYVQAVIRFDSEHELPVMLREQLYQEVNGRYRSWFLYEIGKYAYEHGIPERMRSRADFAYFDDYGTPEHWQHDRFSISGTSPLWTDEYPGQLGAFPVNTHGEFIYKFDLPTSIEQVIISDKHTQKGIGDTTRMWTSIDGIHWTLRYNNWDVQYLDDYYYQRFEEEFDGQTALFIKYAFHAGDTTRTGNDNRGAALDEFSLAVEYQK